VFARAHLDVDQHEQGVRVAGEWALNGLCRAISGDQQRRLLVATTERLMRRGRRGSPTAAPGRPTR